MQELVLTCVSRDAAHRPSFTDIILYLQEFLHLDEDQFFLQFDFHRMMHLISSDRHYFQALGAAEMTIWAFNEKFRLDESIPDWGKNAWKDYEGNPFSFSRLSTAHIYTLVTR